MSRRRLLASLVVSFAALAIVASSVSAATSVAASTTIAATRVKARSTSATATATATAKTVVTSTTCVKAVARWPVSRLLAQMLMLTGTFTHDAALLGSAAAAGVGALEMAFAPGVEPHTTPATRSRVRDEIATLVSDATRAGQVAPIVSTDEEGGVVTRLGGMLGALPSPREMASRWTTANLEEVMATRAREMKRLGFDMDTGPLYTTSPAKTVGDEGSRTFSTSPTVASAYANAFAKGLASGGVLAVGKSFPGEGHANADTDWAVATDPPVATLRGSTLVSFDEGIEANIPVVMVGHPVVPGLTDGQPASVSAATYALLRRTLGFRGLTITDTLGAKAVSVRYNQSAAALKAAEAGADMPMVHASTWQVVLKALEHAASAGALSLQLVRTRVEHVLVAKGDCTGAL